ncbi:MAG: AraC family transcriptional regulator [Siphonobacter sp.]
MRIYIKNMVCDRCKLVVRQTLEQLGLQPERVELGEVDLIDQVSDWITLKQRLYDLGFELLADKRDQIIAQIKAVVLTYIEHLNESRPNLSDYLADALSRDYSSLSKLFSESEGNTIEQYLIRLKIEKVKEMLSYSQQTLSEIASQLGYSSVAHLSNQFKKVTGLTPSQFKNDPSRVSLDQV